MGRWSYLDTDEERLPEGMTRVGYDADTQVYTYRDSDGSYWEGAPGCRYGKLHRVRSATPPLPSVHIPDTVEGDEAPYVLYDDSSDLDDDDDNYTLSHSPSDDEKKHTLTSPDKAKLHNANPPPHHPALAKTLPDLPTTTDDTSSLSGTTARDSVITSPSDVTYKDKEKHQLHNNHSSNSHGLKRTGTLSRIARFLSSAASSSSSSKRNVSRRATVNGGVAESQKKGARLARRSTAADAGAGGTAWQWPGAGAGAAPEGDRMRRRATTFDEILGKD